MKKLQVYLETSYFSYLTGRQTSDRIIAMRQAETRRWWEREAQLCNLFVSGHVLLGCAGGDRDQAAKRVEAAKGIPELDGETKEIRERAKAAGLSFAEYCLRFPSFLQDSSAVPA